MKEKDIEAKLNQVIADWSAQEFYFSSFKTRGELLLKGKHKTMLRECSLLDCPTWKRIGGGLPFFKIFKDPPLFRGRNCQGPPFEKKLFKTSLFSVHIYAYKAYLFSLFLDTCIEISEDLLF